MARRIEIELTSARPDGSWTWRAAGAMQPRGVLEGALLPEGSKAGDVLRAEADFEIDGIVINSVLAPKEKKRSEPERIELLAPSGPAGGVTTQLLGRGDRGDRGGDRRRPRSDDGRPERGRSDRPRRERTDRTSEGPRSDRGGDRTGDGARRERTPGGRPRTGEQPRSGAPRSGEERRGPRPDSGQRGRPAPSERSGGGTGPSRSSARRLNPANTHRQAVLNSLPPEEQPVAEQVLRGGIPAVRTAIHLEREKATSEGRPAPNAEALLALAESLRPRLREAEWRDRAEAAAKVVDSVALRDLRSVVAGADLARSEETRALAVTLRDALEQRLTTMRTEWVSEIDRQLDEGRVVRALRAAARAPEATSRLSAEQATRLSDAASAAMAPTTPPDRWAALLEAVAASPVRRTVTPAGLPAEPGAELLSAAHQQAGRIPALASLLGISIPPPPGPVKVAGGGARNGAAGRNRPSRPERPGRPERSRPAAPAPEAGGNEAGSPEAGAPEAPATEAVAPEAPATEAPATEAPATEAVGPAASPAPVEAPAPEAVTPAPEAVTPAPEAAAPEAAAPEAAAPEAAAPEAGAPEAVVPEAGAPEAVVPEAAAPEAVPAPEAAVAPEASEAAVVAEPEAEPAEAEAAPDAEPVAQEETAAAPEVDAAS